MSFFTSAAGRRAAGQRAWLHRPAGWLLLGLLGLAAFPLLFELGRNPVMLWDESRLAVNAAYMALHGHWLVPHFAGQPDHWNTKPPLLIWLQALGFRALGFTTWVLRLPTALASLGTVTVVYLFGARVLRRPLGGLFGGLVLATCLGYVKLHVARTGDYDALLTLWVTLSWVAFFQYLETGRARYVYWLGAALTAAVLTKTVAGLLGVPGLALYALLRGRAGWLLRQGRLYAVAAASLAVVAGYYLAREAADPGYWKAVVYNDISGRYLDNQGDSRGDIWYYYLENLRDETFGYWLWAMAPAVALALGRRQGGRARHGALLLLCFAGGWLLVVSASASRHDWYDAPLYPALALLLGLGLARLYADVLGLYTRRLPPWQRWVLRVLVAVALFAAPYRAVMRQLVAERHSDFHNGADGYLGSYLTGLLAREPQLRDLTVLYRGDYNASLDFYQLAHEPEGRHLTLRGVAQARQLAPGTVATFCDPAYRARLDSTFRIMPLHDDYPCQTVLLLPHDH